MANPKKIAVLYSGARSWGGVETYIEQVFQNVSRDTLDLTLISMGEWELSKKLKKSGYKVVVRNIPWFNPLGFLGISKDLLQGGFNLIVSQNMVANHFARLASWQSGVPNLVTIHSDYKFDYYGLKELIYLLDFKLFESLTAQYIVVSEFLMSELRKMGVKKEKITRIYNGVKEVAVASKKRSGTLVFGTLGRLHYKKGYHILIKAASLLRHENFVINICGEGNERQNLENLIARYALQDKVYLRGFTTDIHKALMETDVYIQPSLEEGFGITVAEAMYAEKPVIVTSAGSLPELVTDGKTGMVVSPGSEEALASAMMLAIKDPESLSTMSVAARKEALKRFGIDSWIRAIEKEYLKVAK